MNKIKLELEEKEIIMLIASLNTEYNLQGRDKRMLKLKDKIRKQYKERWLEYISGLPWLLKIKEEVKR